MGREQLRHTIPPVFNGDSRVLLLGTFPSPKSRETGFYYGHPQNRFWRLLSDILNQPLPLDIVEKRTFLLNNRIALWDVLASCTIEGADDASIRRPVVNDLRLILNSAPIQAVFTTGSKAGALYQKYCCPVTGRPAVVLPSTSPANCRHYTYSMLKEAYRSILPYLA